MSLKTNCITLILSLLICGSVYSQNGPVGHLTIFSDDGQKFSLVLNGELINTEPQTNLRVEDLNQPYYNAKIIFADKTLNEISKDNLMISDVDGVYSDVTYKIKRDKNNKAKAKLVFFSEVPVQQGFIAPASTHVIHYGQPDIVVVDHGRTTTTTTTQTDGVGFGASVNAAGVNLNISVNDSGFGASTTTTTTTSSSSSHGNHGEEQSSRGCRGRNSMPATDFSNALNSVKKQGFDETKLKVAKQAVGANCMSVSQISQIAQTFGFEENKLDFAKYAYDYCIEPQNYFNLNNIFNFSTNVDDLTEYVESRK